MSELASGELLGRGMEFSGSLDRQKVPDLLQALGVLQQDGVLEVFESRGGSAEIGVVRGQVRWARAGHLRGEEALLGCLFWFEGSYRFRGGQAVPPEDASVADGWKLTPFLLKAMYLGDELEKRRRLVPPATAPLVLNGPFSGQDPFGCGLEQVVAALAGREPITLEQLETTLPLAPIKVRLAVAFLVEQGVLPAAPAEPQRESTYRFSRWWAKVAARYGGRFRLAVLAEDAFVNQEAFSRLVSFFAKKLKVADPWVSFSPDGPSFARLRIPEGGNLSLTFVPWGSTDGPDRVGIGVGHDLVIGLGTGTWACLEKLQALGVPTAAFATMDEMLTGLLKLG